MNKQKLSFACGMGALALVAGFGLAAQPASALPTALSVIRLASPVLDHVGNAGWNDQDQTRREYQENPRRDRQNRERDRENRRRDAENRRRDEGNRRRAEQYQHRDRDNQSRDRDNRDRHDHQDNQDRRRDDNR